MLPKQLIIKAIGPYKNETIIDFTQLREQQLFLITGPTGAGKTMIFDALVYALYGQLSGSSRREDELKSQFATDMDLAYVKLIFELNGKEYDIYRVPAQQGPGKNKKSRKYMSEVTFTTPDHIYSKISEANKAIQDIIGLSAEQFKRIVMLPQGEFKQLLEANSKDKQEIFRRIFETDLLQAFENKLKEQAAEAKNKLDQLAANLKACQPELLEHIADDSTSAKINNWFDKENYGDIADWTAEQLADLTHHQTELLEQLEKNRQQAEQFSGNRKLLQTQHLLRAQLSALRQETPMIEAIKLSLAEYRDTLGTYQLYRAISQTEASKAKIITAAQSNRKRLEELNVRKATLKRESAEWQPLIEQLPALHEQVRLLEEAKHQWQTYRENENQLNLLMEEINATSSAKHKIAADYENIKAEHSATASQIQALAGQIADVSQLNITKAKYEQYRIQLTNAQNQFQKLDQLEAEIAVTNSKYDLLYQQWQRQKQAVSQSEEIYHNNLAGLLAQSLSGGQPCPVCGSVNHPKLAVLNAEEVTKEQMTAERQTENKLFAEVTENAAALKSLAERKKQIKAEMGWEEYAADAIAEQLAARQVELTSQMTAFENQLRLIAEQQLEQNDLQEKFQRQQEQLQHMKDDLSNLSGRAARLAEQFKQEHSTLQNSAVRLKGESLAAVNQEVTDLMNTILIRDNKKQELNNIQTELNMQFTLITDRLELNQIQLTEIEQQIQVQQLELNTALAKLGLDSLQLQDIHEQPADWEALEERIQHYDKQHHTLKTQLAENIKLCQDNNIHQTETDYHKAIQQLKAEQSELQILRDTTIMRHSALQQVSNRLTTAAAAYRQLANKFGELKILSEVANGTLKGSSNVSFERYILAMYFDEIIEMANLRLKEMTSGHFEFRRVMGNQKGGGAKGLDIAVYDYFAGGERSVQSLSGGEGFKASLALALGLSDVMQNYAGGVEINTLFIDEGFGTLDQESLQQAIQTLMQLQQDSGRLIGIISHVEELKEQIPVHLEIFTSEEGSGCEFIGLY